MTGEKLGWFRVASHLHAPVSWLAERMTHSEFLDWLIFLQWKEEQDEKTDYYLAQIAAEVRRGQVKSPRLVKVKDFLLQMKTKAETTSEPEKVRPKKKQLNKSKAAWAAHLKVNLN